MSRIFISYKRVDKEKVFKIKDQIESALGEKCWIDLDGIESDAVFANKIIGAINSCEVFLFMYSKAHSLIDDFNKDWTVREINFASKKGKRIVFINIDGAPLTDTFEFTYGTKQQIDGRDNESIERLIRDLKIWNECDKKLDGINSENKVYDEDKSLISKIKRINWINFYLKDIGKRHRVVNLFLYGLEIVSLLALIPVFVATLWSINLLTDPTWSLSHAYGKGVIPVLLITISVGVFNGMVIRWNKNGFVYLFCLLFIIVLPTMYNEFEEFVVFSIIIFIGLLIYICLLLYRYRGISVWNSSAPINDINRFLGIIVFVIWVFMLTVMPLYMAKAVGFGNNLYCNGARYLDARLNESSYYSHDFANRIGFSDDFVGRRYEAREWFEKSISLAKSEKTWLYDRSFEYICDYLIFLCVNKDSSSVRELYMDACNDYGKDIVDKEIAMGSYSDCYISKSDRNKALKFINYLNDKDKQ